MPLSDFAWTSEPQAYGGFAIVRFATHTPTGTPAAVKQLRPEFLADAEAIERFEGECRTLAEVSADSADHFVEVLGFDLDPLQDVAPWLAMGRYPTNLWEAREAYRDPLACAEAMAHVCAGLALLHDGYQTSHRDLNLKNLFVGTDGKVRIGDFGSRLRSADQHRATGPHAAFPGTPEYQAPECFGSGPLPAAIFPAADVYSVGVMMYELLTGQLPVDPLRAGSPGSLAGKARWHVPPLLRTLRPEVTRELQDVVHQCLEPQAMYRPTSFELAGLLRGAARNAADGSHSQRVFTPSYPETVRRGKHFVLPIYTLAGGGGTTSYHSDDAGRQDIQARSTARLLELPSEVIQATDDYLEWKKADSGEKPYRFQDLNQIRFDGHGFTTERELDAVLTPLFLRTSLTHYYATHRTNFSIDTRLPDGRSIRRKYGGHLDDFFRTELEGSSLANPICVNLSVVTLQDDYLVLAQRANRTGGNPGGYAPAVNGTADLEKDQQVGVYDPWSHGLREGSEEVWGVYPAARQDLVYFGLAMRTDNFCPFLFGEARLDTTADRLGELRQTAKHKDEIAQLIFVRFTVGAVTRAIRDLWELKKLSPTAIFSLYASLIHRYPKSSDQINAEFDKVKPRGRLRLQDLLPTSRYE